METAGGNIVDGIQDSHFAFEDFCLVIKLLNHILGNITQAGILTAREVVDGVAHIFGRVAILLEYRLVDVERVDVDILRADVGIHQHSIVKYRPKLIFGYHFVAVTATKSHQCRQEHYV